MRFRTKLFIAWGLLVLLCWAGIFWPMSQAVSFSFEHMARDSFAGARRTLLKIQAEQATHMQQACELIMNIPDLRALIAESGVELTPENAQSLQERLDSLARIVDVQTIFALDARARIIATSTGANDLTELRTHLSSSSNAHDLVAGLYRTTAANGDRIHPTAHRGIWVVGKRLYQAVGIPLVFGSDSAGAVQGALIVASPLTDAMAIELSQQHGCDVTFIAGSNILASSIPVETRPSLLAALLTGRDGAAADALLRVGSTTYRASYEPVLDPSSGAQVASMLIQRSLAEEKATQLKLWRELGTIGLGGVIVCWIASFFLSGLVTRPVAALTRGVRRVAEGDLSVAIPASGGGEMAELANTFNDMVNQLRSRRELEQQVEKSKAESHAKSQFLANMSHEIRTPLHGVLGMTDILLRTELSDVQQRYVELAQSSARILSGVINDILDFSKIEAGKLEVEKIAMDLPRAVNEVIHLLEPKAGDKNLKLRGELAPALPRTVTGDPNRLQQILLNLVNNALKFTESGGVTLRVFPKEEDVVRFEVTDTGIGIPPDRMARLFQSFSQVDASTTRKFGGTGLGLAICKQLVELMGGAIGVTSAPGRGSTFWFQLPMPAAAIGPDSESVEESTGVTAIADQPRNANSRRLRVLVAEDNEINQLVAEEILKASGFQCQIVSDGAAAVAAVRSGNFDLVLMDCQMPVMDGIEATRAIREEEAAQNRDPIPIIALTANAVSGDREQCLAAGMNGYCGKPINPRELMKCMHEVQTAEARQG